MIWWMTACVADIKIWLESIRPHPETICSSNGEYLAVKILVETCHKKVIFLPFNTQTLNPETTVYEKCWNEKMNECAYI